MTIKVEDVTDTEKKENYVELRVAEIKSEHVVSCMAVALLGIFSKYQSIISFSALIKPLNYGEWNLFFDLFYFTFHVRCTFFVSRVG
jgi:hypothetical protein